jgi:hypothetical protein
MVAVSFGAVPNVFIYLLDSGRHRARASQHQNRQRGHKARRRIMQTSLSLYFVFYVLLPYIIYVMLSRRFSHCPAFLSRTAKERDKKYSVKSPQRYKM